MKISMLTQFIQSNDRSVTKPKILPLVHSCEGYSGKQIIVSEKLKARHCKVFDKNLLYMFYGKPSYPVAEKNEEKRTDAVYCPICFVVNPKKVSIYQVFPFDTGAFMEERYKGFIHRDIELNNYILDSSLDGIQKYISVMFDNNTDYINGICHQQESNSIEIQALLDMLNAKGSSQIDERANTIEVISENDLELTDAIECIILPKNLLRIPEISKFINDNDMKYKTYDIRRMTAPERYNEIVFQLVMEHIKER